MTRSKDSYRLCVCNCVRSRGLNNEVALVGVGLSATDKKNYLITYLYYYTRCGPAGVVGIATAYGLDGPGIESWWDEIFRTCPDRP